MQRIFVRSMPFILIALSVLLLFNQLALTPHILARGDTYNYFYPYWHARDMAFSAGTLPLWTHHIFMGAPLWANPQLGTFYPPNWLSPYFNNVAESMRWSIISHLIWAGWGAYFLMRVALPEAGKVGAIVAGILFAGGGYLGAHAEQINQLQGLAWLGWLFALYHRLLLTNHRSRWALLLAGAWALQLFTGHTQTVVIAGVGMGVYGSVWWLGQREMPMIKRTVIAFGVLAGVVMFVLWLALPQLLPTLEVTGMSQRGGGFNVQEATAFSLPPHYIGRALLPMIAPDFNQQGQLFGEYIATLGILGLGAVIWGGMIRLPHADWRRWAWLALIGIAFFFAMGRANPVYVLLAEFPPFDLFRVPARWLALWALAGAVLGGWGVASVWQRRRMPSHNGWALLVALITGLMLLARFAPVTVGDVTGNEAITSATFFIWVVALAILVVILWRKQAFLWVALIVVELFAASWVMPYNDLVPPEIFTAQRFTLSQLQAYANDQIAPDRYLSISPLFFDLGDRDTLNRRYQGYGINDRAIRNAFVALKKQEVAFPNQSLIYGIHSIDGFGGGILPTVYYSQFTSLLLPADSLRTMDGRLGELLAQPDCHGACIPPLRWLDRMGVGALITDKVYDVWYDDLAYDTTFARAILADDSVTYHAHAPLISDGVYLLADGGVWVLMGDEDTPIPAEAVATIDRFTLYHASLPERTARTRATLQSSTGGRLLAVTMADSQTGNFAMLTPDGWRRALSSDIKLYTRDEQPPRAFIAEAIYHLPDSWQGGEDALIRLQADTFGARDVVVHGADGDTNINGANGQAEITRYDATALTLRVQSDAPSYLVLDTAWYPHWQASIDGQSIPVYRADVMFMAVPIPAGESVVQLRFVPDMWYTAGIVGAGGWLIWASLILAVWYRMRHAN